MGMECIVEFCDKPAVNKVKPGECSGHKAQRTRYGFEEYKPLWYRTEANSVCEVPSCTRAVKAARICTACRKKVNRYGITVDELILLDQSKCMVCRGTERIHIDHDHVTGKFRGVLCGGCNTALGLMKEDSEMIHRLAAYIG